jgi:hypothetical protein
MDLFLPMKPGSDRNLTINQKIAGNSIVHVRGQPRKHLTMVMAGAISAEQTSFAYFSSTGLPNGQWTPPWSRERDNTWGGVPNRS